MKHEIIGIKLEDFVKLIKLNKINKINIRKNDGSTNERKLTEKKIC